MDVHKVSAEHAWGCFGMMLGWAIREALGPIGLQMVAETIGMSQARGEGRILVRWENGMVTPIPMRLENVYADVHMWGVVC